MVKKEGREGQRLKNEGRKKKGLDQSYHTVCSSVTTLVTVFIIIIIIIVIIIMIIISSSLE